MKFYVSIVVHQNDSTQPDYQLLHNLLMEAGFLQRDLDGILTMQPTSGLYQREDAVLNRADIEFDLQTVLDSFSHPCSFQLEQAGSAPVGRPETQSASHSRFIEAVHSTRPPGTLIQ